MEPRLGPDKCLKRWCRICGKEMELEYDFNSENRVYDFRCTRCGTTVRLFEEIFKDMRETFRSDGRLLEPLTKEEEEEQISEGDKQNVLQRIRWQYKKKLERKGRF